LNKVLYQTLEKRKDKAISAGYCKRPNAWLGNGYYFWYNEDDSIKWGQESSYYKAGYFEVYKAEIYFDNILNTVFDEEAYNFFLKITEMAAKYFIKKIDIRPTIKQINDYFKEKGIFKDIDGILFQDIPTSKTYTLVENLYYKKRIQLVVYNKDIILTFTFHDEGACL